MRRCGSAVVAMTIAASSLGAQSAFVQMVRGDTAAIEQFVRSATRLDVTLMAKGAGPQLLRNEISADGRMTVLSLRLYPPGTTTAASPVLDARASVTGDTAIAIITRGTGPSQTQRIPTKATAQPIATGTIAVIEVMLGAARRTGSNTAAMPVFSIANGATVDMTFTDLQSDSVTVRVGASPIWLKTDGTGRILRGGNSSGTLVISRVDGAAVAKLGVPALEFTEIRASKPDYAAPDGAPYTAEAVTIPTTFGHSLGGTFTKPAKVAGLLPVVISITGSGPQDRDEYIGLGPKGYRLFRQVADTLGRRGIAMLRYDDRGVGESGGNHAAATSRDFANDVRAAIAYLRTRRDIDPRRIMLVGHSEGGMIAPMVALDEPQLAGIVLMAGTARTGRQIIEFQNKYAIERDTTLSPARRAERLAQVPSAVDSVLKTAPWLRFFGDYDPTATAKRVKTPVLILQGSDDQQVIASEATMLARTFRSGGNRDVTMRVFPALNHFFVHQPGGDPAGYATLVTDLASAEVLGVLTEWVVTHASRSSR